VRFKSRASEVAFVFFLTLLFAPSMAGAASATAPDAPANRQYRLRFLHTHTGEKLDVVYREGDSYVPGALAELDHFLRDYRSGEVRHYDPRLFDLLYELLDAAGRPERGLTSSADTAIRTPILT